MAIRNSLKVPEPILQLQQQLDQWRGAQKGRAKLPESFWQAAVELAKQYGVYQTAQPLRRLCQDKPAEDPFSGCVFVFRSRSGTAIRLLTYDGQGCWLAQN